MRNRDPLDSPRLRMLTAMVEHISCKLALLPRTAVAQYANRIAEMANAEPHVLQRHVLCRLHRDLLDNVAAYGDALHEGIVPLTPIESDTWEIG